MVLKSRPKILIVDDAAIIREPLARALEESGYRVIQSPDGDDAIHQLVSAVNQFDVIILDYGLPKMDGIAFLKQMREEEAWVKIPVIMLTESGQDTVVNEAVALGVKGYLLKSSFTLDELDQIIRSQLTE